LGRVYWRQQKYPEAETALRKQIEVTPLDKWAHGNLGLMMVEWRKYKEAVPELEQAISLNPEQEFEYQIGLGRAYLNLQQNETAIKAFERAVKLEPGQHTWNDIAYFLAEGKVQLDMAQQYAESAVTEVATELRNVELERLTLDDLENVAALAANWDTLGWVYFQKGNLDVAEKYIGGTWSLQQHGEVGYHLGQIFEKQGKKEAAIRMYALAAVADRTVPEARASLERLAGKEKSEALLKKANEESGALRTIEVGSLPTRVKATAEAQFYVALVPGVSGLAQVSAVKFISGDEKLRSMEGALKSAKYNLTFPDSTNAKIIRRGRLSCVANGNCSFIMISPDLISSVD
jgi:tetratricopeptide (TPR) repeat protein